jgi:hypothetical protein
VKRKKDIDQEAARLLDMPFDKVAMVTGCFLRTVLHEVVDNGGVLVDGFGRFLLKEQKNIATAHLEKGTFKKGGRRGKMVIQTRRKFRVWFKKSAEFRRSLMDAYGKESTMEDMEKLGVDEGTDQEELEKQAAAGCPECGQTPIKHGKVLACPTHGTEPFEKAR